MNFCILFIFFTFFTFIDPSIQINYSDTGVTCSHSLFPIHLVDHLFQLQLQQTYRFVTGLVSVSVPAIFINTLNKTLAKVGNQVASDFLLSQLFTIGVSCWQDMIKVWNNWMRKSLSFLKCVRSCTKDRSQSESQIWSIAKMWQKDI